MNSVGFRGESDHMQGQPRWSKSTLSFREMLTFLEVENKFSVLSFENNEGGEFSSQDSNPVSVLDFDQFIIDPEVTTSGNGMGRIVESMDLTLSMPKAKCSFQKKELSREMVSYCELESPVRYVY
ncbi:hypothetical protein SADUNF_Sadunf16G0141200 [Salix dunnii]|uniref:Uncharacterized protein n=1 Tax=Salix dunnii TaxID=1413687 RepID=A0A835J6R7_9ROSI|nr:hypothetical protein SADUNF_Sadunf16G0141200 [Salix dunnii]